jgi:hypothetical protein
VKEFDRRRARRALSRVTIASVVIMPATVTLVLWPFLLLSGEGWAVLGVFVLLLVVATLKGISLLRRQVRFLETIHKSGTERGMRVVSVSFPWLNCASFMVLVEDAQGGPKGRERPLYCWALPDQTRNLKPGDIVQVLDARGAPGMSRWQSRLLGGGQLCLPMWKEDRRCPEGSGGDWRTGRPPQGATDCGMKWRKT